MALYPASFQMALSTTMGWNLEASIKKFTGLQPTRPSIRFTAPVLESMSKARPATTTQDRKWGI